MTTPAQAAPTSAGTRAVRGLVAVLLQVVVPVGLAAGLAAGETRLAAMVIAAGLVLVGWGVLLWWVRRHPDWLDAAELLEQPRPRRVGAPGMMGRWPTCPCT